MGLPQAKALVKKQKIIVMNSLIRMFFGIPPVDNSKKKNFEIKCKMINPDVVRMDMKSFRESLIVRQQVIAAKAIKNEKGLAGYYRKPSIKRAFK